MLNKLIILTAILLSLLACEQKVYNQEVCENLSIKSYRGNPQAAAEFEENCQGIPNDYTQAICQKGLNALIMGARERELKQKFGPKIMKCFGEHEINKWLKREKR